MHSNQAAATPASPPPALTVSSVSPTGTSVAAGSTITVQFSTDLAPEQPAADTQPAGGRQLGGAVAVVARVPSDRAARARRDRNGDRPRRSFRRHRLRRSAHGPVGHVAVHRRAWFHPSAPTAPGRTRVPPPDVHAGLAADVADAGGQQPGRVVHLAVGESAACARDAVDARCEQRHHDGCRHELRDPERPEDRRRRRPAGVDRPSRRRAEREGRRQPVELRPRQSVAPRVGHRLLERRRRLQHTRSTREWPERPRQTAPSPSTPDTP